MSVKMRKLTLRSLEKGEGVRDGYPKGVREKIDYQSYFLNALVQCEDPRTGVSVDESRKVMPLLDRIEDAEVGESIHITDTEYSILKKKVGSLRTVMVSRVAPYIQDEINSLPEEDMVPAE